MQCAGIRCQMSLGKRGTLSEKGRLSLFPHPPAPPHAPRTVAGRMSWGRNGERRVFPLTCLTHHTAFVLTQLLTQAVFAGSTTVKKLHPHSFSPLHDDCCLS